jgi:dihydroorotase
VILGNATFENVNIVDEDTDMVGTVLVEDGIIRDVRPAPSGTLPTEPHLVLMPAFVDLHAHFRDPGFTEKECLETASKAAVAGGYGTVVCMANTNPVTDTFEKARAIKSRSDALNLIDLYPAMALTVNMEGKVLTKPPQSVAGGRTVVKLLSEDGKDIADDAAFLAALKQAAALGLPVSLHCDLGGEDAATKRAMALGAETGCHIHIAHVSTREAVSAVRAAKNTGVKITAEVTPHHIALNRSDAERLGAGTFGKVAPPLRSEDDRQALIEGLLEGTIDAIATDHAPHTAADKERGAPGFTGLETAFAVCYTVLVKSGLMDIRRLSALMSAEPARILGFTDRGRIAAGLRADFVLVNTEAEWTVAPERFVSRGKNTPFAGQTLWGKVLLGLHFR